jgi:hypothetical protein
VLAGRDVHVVLMSTGATSNVLAELNGTAADPTWWGGTHDPIAEGYEPLTAGLFGLARTDEWRQSWRHLGVGPDGQHFGAGVVSSAVLPDQITPEYATEVMRYWSDFEVSEGRPRPGFYTMWWGDPTADHAACGQALRALRLSDPDFADSRWMVKPGQAAAAAAQVYSVPPNVLPEVKARQRRAAWAYGAWAPSLGSYAIGMHSVGGPGGFFQEGPLAGAPNHIVRVAT